MTVSRLVPLESPLARVVPVLRAPNHGVRSRLHRKQPSPPAPAARPEGVTALLGTEHAHKGCVVDVRA